MILTSKSNALLCVIAAILKATQLALCKYHAFDKQKAKEVFTRGNLSTHLAPLFQCDNILACVSAVSNLGNIVCPRAPRTII